MQSESFFVLVISPYFHADKLCFCLKPSLLNLKNYFLNLESSFFHQRNFILVYNFFKQIIKSYFHGSKILYEISNFFLFLHHILMPKHFFFCLKPSLLNHKKYFLRLESSCFDQSRFILVYNFFNQL